MFLISTILFGGTRLDLGIEYLILLAFVIALDLFFWLAIFVLRRNIMAEESLDVVGKFEALITNNDNPPRQY